MSIWTGWRELLRGDGGGVTDSEGRHCAGDGESKENTGPREMGNREILHSWRVGGSLETCVRHL